MLSREDRDGLKFLHEGRQGHIVDRRLRVHRWWVDFVQIDLFVAAHSRKPGLTTPQSVGEDIICRSNNHRCGRSCDRPASRRSYHKSVSAVASRPPPAPFPHGITLPRRLDSPGGGKDRWRLSSPPGPEPAAAGPSGEMTDPQY